MRKLEFIDLKGQYQLYKPEIDAAIQTVLDTGSYIMGPQIAALEEALASFTGVKHCISVSSGTDSLLIALMALGIKAGDEVITTPFSWISSSEVILLAGAKPVFVDIELDTYNIDVNQLEQAISPKTKAILPVSLFGQMPNFSRINAIAEKYNLPVIEDGAQSFGAAQKGQKSCGVTTVGSTSFFPAKPLGCYGDGGALFTNDDQLAAKMRAIRTHGGEKRHHHPYLGLNGRLDTLQAAILLAKWPYFKKEVSSRERIGERYNSLLRDVCQTPEIAPGNTHVFAQYTLRIPNRQILVDALQKENIPHGIYYPKCLHEQPVFSSLGYRTGDFPCAEMAASQVISLPMHPFLSTSDQNTIVDVVRRALP